MARTLLLAAICFILLGLASARPRRQAVGDGTQAVAQVNVIRKGPSSFELQPSPVSVFAGDKVVFTYKNPGKGSIPNKVAISLVSTSDAHNIQVSNSIEDGQTWTFVADGAGVFDIKVNGHKAGSLIVSGRATGAGSGDGTNAATGSSTDGGNGTPDGTNMGGNSVNTESASGAASGNGSGGIDPASSEDPTGAKGLSDTEKILIGVLGGFVGLMAIGTVTLFIVRKVAKPDAAADPLLGGH